MVVVKFSLDWLQSLASSLHPCSASFFLSQEGVAPEAHGWLLPWTMNSRLRNSEFEASAPSTPSVILLSFYPTPQ